MKLRKPFCVLILLISSAGFTMENSIYIQWIEKAQQISEILKISTEMGISKNPKKLSKAPKVVCFTANIEEFLLNPHASKPIYGCIFSDQVAMNASLLRAGLFVHTKTGIATDEKLFNSNLMTAVGGHDFNGKELLDYKSQVAIPMKTLTQYELLKRIESEFDRKVITPIIEKNKDNFIFFSIINTRKFKENLSHELLHAQYYNMPEIQPILLQVWDKAPSSHQKIIINALQNGGYDMDQQELLLREFYSYFLQYNAKNYLAGIKVLSSMAPLADIYGPKLQKVLMEKNVKIVTAD